MSEDNVYPFTVERKPKNEQIEELNKTYAVVLFGNKAVVMRQGKDADGRPDLSFIGTDHFKIWLANKAKEGKAKEGKAKEGKAKEGKAKPLADYWLKHPKRRQYDGVVFRPKQEVPHYFNLWTGFAVEPKAGCCEKFLAHVLDNVCRKDEHIYNWFIGFFADIFQNPGSKKDTSLALKGRQGSGKTKVAEIIGSLLGNHYVSAADPRYVTGQFNKHMLSCLLFCADEGFWAGDKKAEGKVRDLISGKKHPIELKGKEAVWVDNYVRLLVLGEADWVVPAALSERRFAVLDVGEDHIQDHAYFAAIDEEMNNGGREALLDYLFSFDLTKVNLRKIPNTAALTDQKIASLNINQRWWLDMLTRGELPGCDQSNSCVKDVLHYSYIQSTNQIDRSRKATQTELGRFLHDYVKGLDGNYRTTDSKGKRQPRYRFPTLKECRRLFAEKMQADLAWDDQEEWESDNDPL